MALYVDSIVVELDESVYSLDCAQRAANYLGQYASFNFARTSAGKLQVEIVCNASFSADQLDLKSKYLSELLDQALRTRIADETATERNLVLAYAFSNTKLVG